MCLYVSNVFLRQEARPEEEYCEVNMMKPFVDYLVGVYVQRFRRQGAAGYVIPPLPPTASAATPTKESL